MSAPESIASALKFGKDTDPVRFFSSDTEYSLQDVRAALSQLGLSESEVLAMSVSRQNALTTKLRRRLARAGARPAATPTTPVDLDETLRARGELHRALRPWARGELRLERPQGSSYHMMSEWDATLPRPSEGLKYVHEIDEQFGAPQLVLVESDWARSLGDKDEGGEVRVPWPRSCWEFRISGVRVLAMITVERDRTSMFLLYGRDRKWVSDDYAYILHESGAMTGKRINPSLPDAVEFRAANELVHRQIRAILIMLDVGVARHENQRASATLVARRRAERRPAPRDHLVVRLTPRAATRSRSGPRIAGPAVPRSRQRGHLRRGCWVHYDDQDSGEQQYVNDGGFVVSRTWRKWHWAGDLDNMIEREYRL